jgi:hypothetical protein
MAVTPNRVIWLEVDGPEQSTVLRPSFRQSRGGADMAKSDGWVARVNPDGSLLEVAGSINTRFCPGDVWTLKPYNQRAFDILTSGFSGGLLGPSAFTVAPNLRWQNMYRPPTDLPGAGGGGFTTVAPAMRRRVPAGQAWDHANAMLGADQTAYPPPDDPDWPAQLPVDRVAFSNADYEPNMGFGLTFGMANDFWSSPAFMRVYWGGPVSMQPTTALGGAFCLVLFGSGHAVLYEWSRPAGNPWARRKVFRWAEADTIRGGSHTLYIWPMAFDRILFITRITDQPAGPGGLVMPPMPGVPISNPVETLYQDTAGQTGHRHLTSMTGTGKFRIDLRRDYRMPIVPWLLKFPASGVVRDEPFVIPHALDAGTPLLLNADRFMLGGASVTGRIYDAETGVVLPVSGGYHLAPQSKQKFFVEFQLLSGGVAAPGNQTPVIFGYSVETAAVAAVRSKIPARCKVREGSVTGPDIQPGHGSATVTLRRAPCLPGDLETMEILRLHDRRYARIRVDVPTTGPSGDPRGHVILHAGETWQPKAQLRGRAGLGNLSWWDFQVPMIDMWFRVDKQRNYVLRDYNKDYTAPVTIGSVIVGYQPWVIMAVIRDLFLTAGILPDELDTPGWDDPGGLRFWHSPNLDENDYLLQPGSGMAPTIRRLAFDLLGKVVIHDPNAFQGDNLLRGLWRVLDPPQPVEGTGGLMEYPLINSKATFYVKRPPGVEGETRIVEDEGALGPQSAFIKDGSYFNYPQAPEGTSVMVTGQGELFPFSSLIGGNKKLYAFVWNSKAVDFGPDGPSTADPASIDYMDRWEPIVVNDHMLPNQDAVNYVAARVARQAIHGRLWCEFVAPCLFIQDLFDDKLGTRRRPLRVYDQVTLWDEHGASHPVMLRSVNPFWRSSRIMWAWYSGLFLDAR